MESSAFVSPIVEYCGTQFPKTCPVCQKRYPDFETYLQQTQAVGALVWHGEREEHPIPTLSMANCSCGSTMSLECGDTRSETYRGFMAALASDSGRLGAPPHKVLEMVRDEIRKVACLPVAAS